MELHDYLIDDFDLKEVVIKGLSKKQKSIPPKCFYDQTGSKLFDEICQQPEYYIPNVEMDILQAIAPKLAGMLSIKTLIEMGSGASKKVRLLLDAISGIQTYIPIDISKTELTKASSELEKDFPGLHVSAVCTDYTQDLSRILPLMQAANPKLVFFPGSTIGNQEPESAMKLLSNIRQILSKGDHLLIGFDLGRDEEVLNRAYNDAAGKTAAFNINVLEPVS